MGLYTDVRSSIRRVALSALSEFPNPQVIFSHLSGSEPSESYVVINILEDRQIGHHMTSTLADSSNQLSIQTSIEIMVQFSFIGSLSGEMCKSFSQRINNNPIALEDIKRNKLGILRKSQIRRAPQKRDTKWVEYHNIDVTFNYIANTNQVIDVVEGVVLEDNTSEIPLLIKIPESIIYP